jgi:hypothetical protein
MSVNIESQVRPEIRSMLRRLRGRIRQYVLIDAIARVVALLGVLFWLSFGMNHVYFFLTNLELPVGLRMAFGWVSIVGSALIAGWLVIPLLRMMRDKALALVLERRFPELDDRLITAVEVAASRTGHDSDLTAHMLKNTIDGVSRTVEQLHIGEVFDQRPRRRSLMLAAALAVTIGGMAVVNFNAMKVWADAYINYEDVYWDRQTTIIITVIAQPNDREKDFLDEDGNPTRGLPGTYKHPRDEELTLVIEIPHRTDATPVENLATAQRAIIERLEPFLHTTDEAKRKAALKRTVPKQEQLIADAKEFPDGSKLKDAQFAALTQALQAVVHADVLQALLAQKRAVALLDDFAKLLRSTDWKVPDTIDLDYRLAKGRGSMSITLRLKDKGGRKFLHTIGSLTDTIEALYIKGGDFANRQPYKVIVVESPGIDRIVLESNYPNYTGRADYDDEGRPVRDRQKLQGAQTALPLETEFLLHAFANKPLVGVRLQADINEQDVKDIEVQLKPFRKDQAGSARLIISAMDGSRRTVDLPTETAWRFRLIPEEMKLAKQFDGIVESIKGIRETRDADGKVHRLTAATAADGLERLGKLAKESDVIEESYRKLLKEMDRNSVYPRLMLERMRSSILTPLAGINRQLFPATERLLKALASTAKNDSSMFDREVAARKGVEVMLLAMNNVLDEMSDGTRFDVPFHISSRALARLTNETDELLAPLPLPPDREIRIYLEDIDDIIGTSPTRLTINGTVDQPPLVETRLRGISTAITRRARIPVTGIIRDDYGIIKARFEFMVDANRPAPGAEAAGQSAADEADVQGDNPEGEPPVVEEQKWRIRQFRIRPEDTPLEFVLERSLDDRYPAARFEVLPLDLQIGQELTLTVYAEDGDDVNGPHSTHGEKYRFRVVSNEELLSILYGRELGIRRRFEQIIEEVEETKQDLALHRERLAEADKLRADGNGQKQQDKLQEIDAAVGNSAGRSFHQVSKNHSEARDVAQSFLELLEELSNNGVHTDEQVRRIEALIVAPLDEITKIDFPAVLTTVNLFKQTHEKGADSRRQIGDSIETLDTLLLHMQKVLDEMEDLVEFHEALKDLETIIQQQTDLKKATLERQKKEAIERLKNLKGLGLD